MREKRPGNPTTLIVPAARSKLAGCPKTESFSSPSPDPTAPINPLEAENIPKLSRPWEDFPTRNYILLMLVPLACSFLSQISVTHMNNNLFN
ncbi:MAG: hypothetical protein AB2693_29925 [Candidatus Thiodiazotropha sp.]